MSLTIKEKHGVFVVEGALNLATVNTFQDRCEALLNAKEDLTLHIENLTEIDNSGIHIIQTLYMKAKQHSKGFTVIGNISENLYHRLRDFSRVAIAA